MFLLLLLSVFDEEVVTHLGDDNGISGPEVVRLIFCFSHQKPFYFGPLFLLIGHVLIYPSMFTERCEMTFSI